MALLVVFVLTTSLPTMLHTVQTTRMLDEEEHEDTELKVRFKEKWRRAVSSQLTGTLRNEVSLEKMSASTLSTYIPTYWVWLDEYLYVVHIYTYILAVARCVPLRCLHIYLHIGCG